MQSVLNIRPENMPTSRIISGAFTPFIVTPVSDRSTDKFILKYREKVDSLNLKIVTRWGSVVYEAENYDDSWDGANVAAGTYYYEAKVCCPTSGNKTSHRGWIVVVK